MRDRVAIVTGTASGIGRAVAEAFAKSGVKLVLVDRQPEGAVLARGTGAHFVEADLCQRANCRRVIDETLKAYGGIDFLINNAGFQCVSSIEEFPEDKWDEMISVLLTAPFLLTKYAWPEMKRNNFGRIVNIASIHGLVASPFKAAYVSAKHGLVGFTKAAALEGGSFGITVNAICPAYVRTPLVYSQIENQSKQLGMSENEVISKVMLEPAAIKRLIEPEEVAALVLYLCSDSGRSVTGASWTMDLGWTAK